MPIEYYWSIISIYQLLNPDGYEIYVYTSRDIHLKLYWTDKAPWVHRIAKVVRGLRELVDAHWCFIDMNIIDEVHPGEHKAHYFNWPNWQICNRRWFRFKGTIGPYLSPSDSPIYEKHYPGFCTKLSALEPWTWKGGDMPDFKLLFEEKWS